MVSGHVTISRSLVHHYDIHDIFGHSDLGF